MLVSHTVSVHIRLESEKSNGTPQDNLFDMFFGGKEHMTGNDHDVRGIPVEIADVHFIK
jgi:hypothetical protein